MSIKRNFIFNSILTVTQLLSPLITYPYVLRILNPSSIGIISFAQTFSNYFIIISTLGIGIYGQREIAINKDDIEKRSKIFFQILSIHISSAVIVSIIYLGTIFTFAKFQHNISFFIISTIPILFNSISIEWFFKGMEKFKYITIYSVIIRFFFIIAVFVTVKTQLDFFKYYILIVTSIFLPPIINIIYVQKYVHFNSAFIKFHDITTHAKKLITTSLYMILTSIYAAFPIIALGFLSTNSEVGFYSVSDKIIKMFISIFTAFSMVMFPRMSTLYGNGQHEEFKKLITQSFSIIIPIAVTSSVVVFFNANHFMNIFAGKQFHSTSSLLQALVPLLIIIPIAQIFVTQILLPLQKEKIVLKFSLISAIIGIILNFTLIPFRGSQGSAFAIIISELTMTIFAASAVYKYTDVKFPFTLLIKNLLTSIIIIPLIVLIAEHLLCSTLNIIIWSSFFSAAIFILSQKYLLKNPHITKIVNHYSSLSKEIIFRISNKVSQSKQ